MDSFFSQISQLITTPPGNLAYHLVLVFAIAGTLANAIRHRKSNASSQVRRLIIGLCILLVIRVVLFLGAGLTWQGISNPHILLPPLDRAVNIISLLVICWLWAFPESWQLTDWATLLVGALVIPLLGLSLSVWVRFGQALYFNAFWLHPVWEIFSLLVALSGLFLLWLKKPNFWEPGMTMLGILGLGHALQFLFPIEQSDFPAGVRFAQMVAYPLLFILTQRFTMPQVEERRPANHVVTSVERRRYSTELETLQSLLSMAATTSPKAICQEMTRAMANAMLADLCLLFSPPDSEGNLKLLCGYDLIREASLKSVTMESDQVPILSSAFERGRPLRLPASSTSPDLLSLGLMLGLGRSGPLLAVPLMLEKNQVLAGLTLLSPYSNRTWSAGDQVYLEAISKPLARILYRVYQRTRPPAEIGEAQAPPEELQMELEHLRVENQALRAQLSGVGGEEGSPVITALLKFQQESREIISKLQQENKKLRATLEKLQQSPPDSVEENKRLMGELRLALEEIAHLKESLYIADKRLEWIKSGQTDQDFDEFLEKSELISSLTQELRQPVASILGYTDLLLSESAGIIGALQKKFLERIKASTERIDSLIYDLIHLTSQDQGLVTPKTEKVDLNSVFDDVIAQTSQPLREKNIVLRIDLPERLPNILADKDALTQILVHLLNNAGLTTPPDGEISLKVFQQAQENGGEVIHIQVTDTGGGIPEEDLPRVFNRLYRADNPQIQGVGDSGVGLSIAKTLVNSMNGRIWVESEMGKGATFHLVLPLRQPEESEEG
jgi:signal transduction histidine kinase